MTTTRSPSSAPRGSAEARTLPLFPDEMRTTMSSTAEIIDTTEPKKRAQKKARYTDQVTFRLRPATRKKLEAIRKLNAFDSLAQAARFALETMI